MNNRLKSLRKIFNLTQAEFAEKLGISQTYYSDIENGRKDLSATVLLSLEALNVSLHWLISGKGGMFENDRKSAVNLPDPSGDLSAAVKLLAEMPEEYRKDCLHFIQDKKVLLDLQKRVEKLEHKCQITPK